MEQIMQPWWWVGAERWWGAYHSKLSLSEKIEAMGRCSKGLKVVQKTAAVARRKFDERRRENKRFLVGLLLSAGSYEVNTTKQGAYNFQSNDLYSTQEQIWWIIISHSPRYNKPCKDACASRGEDYFWCKTIDNSWGYCSPKGGLKKTSIFPWLTYETRLTYNCAHLRLTKETLTIEFFKIIL